MRRPLVAVAALLGVFPLTSHHGAAALSAQARSQTPDVIFVGTPMPVVEAMLRLAQVTSGDVVYDLGSGDGRIVIAAAKEYGARGVGIEIDPDLVRDAAENARRADVSDRVHFLNQNLFDADMSEATVVTLYLLPSLNARLQPKLTQLRPGTRIVSHAFGIGTWAPQQTMEVAGEKIYFWTIPGKKK
jgi:ribosomal protein L11 methylase PrmA